MSAQAARGLLDTNVVILIERLPKMYLPAKPLICSVTVAELAVGPHVTTDAEARAIRQAHLDLAAADFGILPFGKSCALAYGTVVGSFDRSGRKSMTRALDAMIAAVALANGLPLYTCNPADFTGIEGLEIVSIPHPDKL